MYLIFKLYALKIELSGEYFNPQHLSCKKKSISRKFPCFSSFFLSDFLVYYEKYNKYINNMLYIHIVLQQLFNILLKLTYDDKYPNKFSTRNRSHSLKKV